MFNKNSIKKQVLLFNKKLLNSNLVFKSFGNLSARYLDTFIIKPSGVNLENTHFSKMCIYKKKNILKPSVDSPIHEEIYKYFKNVNSVVHTHSKFATSFCQAGIAIDCLGTTHADYFYGKIPIINMPNKKETFLDFEKNTGKKIVNYFDKKKIDPEKIKAILLKGHGVVAWGASPQEAYDMALIVEHIAELNFYTLHINNKSKKIPQYIVDKHFKRKNGKKKYYGQR